jgi:hypothetical protein
MRLDEVTYDFDRDEWVAHRLIQARWIERELPPPVVAPTQGLWHSSPIRPRITRRTLWTAAPVALLLLYEFGVFIASAGTDTSAFGLTVFWAIICFAIYGLSKVVPKPMRIPATDEDCRLLEDPTDQDTCLVQVTIFRAGQKVGEDRGVAWFDGGRLLFNGRSTSFAVGGEDVLPRRLWAHQPNLDRILAVPLRCSGQTYLHFALLNANGLPADHQERFVERFGAFRCRPPQSRGPRQWPPFE